MSQAELARRVGLRQSTVNALVNGQARTTRSLRAIARELQTTEAYLNGETDDPDSDMPDAPPLTADERGLIDGFRALDGEQQAVVLALVRSMAGHAAMKPPAGRLHASRSDYSPAVAG